MSLLINLVGLLIIDIGAMLYGESSEPDSFKSFMLFLVTNIIGGLLHRYKWIKEGWISRRLYDEEYSDKWQSYNKKFL